MKDFVLLIKSRTKSNMINSEDPQHSEATVQNGKDIEYDI
jgi:hypothetical protein